MRRPVGVLAAVSALVLARGEALHAQVPGDRLIEAPRRLAESQRGANPTVEVVTRETLLRRGARDVGDALAALPGIQVIELADGRRALVLDGWTARALLMIDARPIARDLGGEVDLSALPMSVDEIARIEVIRQPMSHVYGSGAEGGVINVVTHRLRRTGASATVSGHVLTSIPPAGGGQASAGASYQGEQGGVYAHGLMHSTPPLALKGEPLSGRRVMGLGIGAALRLHPRVLARGDGEVRELEVRFREGQGTSRRLRRAQASGEMVVGLQGGDTLHVELRGSAVTSGSVAEREDEADRTYAQGAWLRYVGEPISTHLVQGEAGIVAEAGGPSAGGFSAVRIRGAAMLADSWHVGRNFTIEAALRVEATDPVAPAFAPSLSFRYEPLKHVFLRAAVAAGYRYDGLVPSSERLPSPLTPRPGERGAQDAGRGARLGAIWQPDERMHLSVELFRTDMAASAFVLQTGALALGAAFGRLPLQSSAHVQGVRMDWELKDLVGGVGVRTGYVFLQQAVDDVTSARLPYAARHDGAVLVDWSPSWMEAGLELGVRALINRVDQVGQELPHQLLMHAAAHKKIGPVDLSIIVDNATNQRDRVTGPRVGRSVRLVLHGEH